jgi:hypothetical protein
MPAKAGIQQSLPPIIKTSACDYWIIRLRG